ncbi:MAG: SH3 domain-containing protein [Anaerolineae bacterium]
MPPYLLSHRHRDIALLSLIILLLLAWAPATGNAAGKVEGVVQADLLNVRSGPSTAYPVIGGVRAGQKLTLTGKNDNATWWQIDFKGKSGWVSGEWVKTSGPADELAVVKVAPPPARAATAAAVAVPRSAPPGFFGYGIQIDPWGNRGEAIALVKDMGFTWVKFQLPWKDFEGQPGVRNWPDDVVNDLYNNGLQILVSIVKAPNWARPANTDFSVEGPPADPATYASFVGEFAARYCGRVQAIEVWNEQNMHYEWGNEPPDPARYVRLLAAAYNAIKQGCGSTIVVSGAPTPAGNVTIDGQWRAVDDQAYLRAMYRNELAQYSDAIGVHPSGFNVPPDVTYQQACGVISGQGSVFRGACETPHPSWSFRSTMEGYWAIMRANGDSRKRLWPTEFGWASTGSPRPGYEYALDNTEQEQADYIVRAYQLMRNWDFVGVAFLWNLNYNVTHPHEEQAAFGIQGRPAYDAVRAARFDGRLP